MKLTLRDLFAVVTLAAVLVAWWVDRTRLTAAHAAQVKQFQFDLEFLSEFMRENRQKVVLTPAGGVDYVEEEKQELIYQYRPFRDQTSH